MTRLCVFCSCVDGESAASFIYQDDIAVAFMDLFPVHAGHTLIVPRLHVEDLLTCPKEVAGHLFQLSRQLAPAVVKASKADGFNVWTANGRAAGQEVFHLHLHLLPRFECDEFGLRFPKDYPQRASRAALDTMAQTIRSMV